jgi:hypothetical protein
VATGHSLHTGLHSLLGRRPGPVVNGLALPGLTTRHAEVHAHGGRARQSGGGLPDPLLPAMRSSAKATERQGEWDEPVLWVARLVRSPDIASSGDGLTVGRVGGVGRLQWARGMETSRELHLAKGQPKHLPTSMENRGAQCSPGRRGR